MLYHTELLKNGFAGKRKLALLIKEQHIKFGGNRKLLIYGKLHCASGKRMHTVNRVFFANKQEALANGYRPCGHCMRQEYLLWKEAH